MEVKENQTSLKRSRFHLISDIIENFTSTHDWLDCGNLTLSCLEFVLRDSYGNIVPLHGSSVSFSIVFSKQS